MSHSVAVKKSSGNNLLQIAGLVLASSVAPLAIAGGALAQDATVLERITVVSEGEENIEATGGTVITQQDLEDLQPADVSELFSRGSSVTVSGGGGPAKRVHVFGMEQSNLAVSVDGVPQTATSWHHTGSNVIDPAFLKRVEVEAGAAAADAGFAAAAGAIRYETVGAKDLLEDGKNLGARMSASWGSNGRGGAGSAAAYGRTQQFDWFIMSHLTEGDNYKNGDGLEILGTEPAARNFLGKFGYETDESRFELSYERSVDDADRLIKANMGLAGDTVHPMEVTRHNIKFSYTSIAPTDMWDPEVMVYFSENDYWRDNYANRTNGNMVLNEDLYGGKVQNTFTLDRGSVTAGIDFGRHDYKTDNYGNQTPRYREFYTEQVGAFVQGRFDFDNGFKISSGARYDFHHFEDWNKEDRSDSGGSVNATVAYAITDNIEVFAGASRTWLGYVIGDYGYVHARDALFATDPNFEAGSARNFKGGVNFSGDNWNAGITLFDTRIAGLPSYGTSFLSNENEYRSRGVTLNARYRFLDTTIGGTYTKADVTLDGATAIPNGATFMPVGDMATLFVDHEFVNYNVKVGASLEWAGSIDAISTFYEEPSYTVVNAYAEWTPQQWENATLRLSVDNLFDETYYERSSYAASSARGGIDPVWAPGRTFTVQLTTTF
ncbi:TonB-dependent receptor domain-containing protein [Hoeflea olei]|uniref:Ligand-gated channel n=1 Tax=Hoeflea olei TaxID=1480615 RepID=A0A1C1YV76_9HYPH|nr:TonB-dependent receptor [Hoeflea olei]OCW57385.1 ligand-gated channel [Hoeflea olei]